MQRNVGIGVVFTSTTRQHNTTEYCSIGMVLIAVSACRVTPSALLLQAHEHSIFIYNIVEDTNYFDSTAIVVTSSSYDEDRGSLKFSLVQY
jgi:hypothetical protein